MLIGDGCVFVLILMCGEHLLGHDLITSVCFAPTHSEFSSSIVASMTVPAEVEVAPSSSPQVPTSVSVSTEAEEEEAALPLLSSPRTVEVVDEGQKEKKKKNERKKRREKRELEYFDQFFKNFGPNLQNPKKCLTFCKIAKPEFFMQIGPKRLV